MKYNPVVTSPKKIRQVLNIQNNFSIEDLAFISGYSLEEITGRCRVADLAEWRQIIHSYLRSQEFGLDQIGIIMNRDHATIVHSCKSVLNLMKMHDKQMVKKVHKMQNAICKPNIDILLMSESLLNLQNEFNRR